MSKQKMILVLVDPSKIHMPDLLNAKIPGIKGTPVIRYRRSSWGEYKALELFFIGGNVKEFDSVEEFKEYFEEANNEPNQ